MLYDYFRFQRGRLIPDTKDLEEPSSMDGTIYEAAFEGLCEQLLHLLHGNSRFFVPALALALGAYLTTSLTSGINSTYICPLILGERTKIPFLQLVGAAIDGFILAVASELSQRAGGNGTGTFNRGSTAIGWMLLVSSCSNGYRPLLDYRAIAYTC